MNWFMRMLLPEGERGALVILGCSLWRYYTKSHVEHHSPCMSASYSFKATRSNIFISSIWRSRHQCLVSILLGKFQIVKKATLNIRNLAVVIFPGFLYTHQHYSFCCELTTYRFCLSRCSVGYGTDRGLRRAADVRTADKRCGLTGGGRQATGRQTRWIDYWTLSIATSRHHYYPASFTKLQQYHGKPDTR